MDKLSQTWLFHVLSSAHKMGSRVLRLFLRTDKMPNLSAIVDTSLKK